MGALALSSRGYSRYRHSELEIWAVLSMLGCVTVHAEPKHEVGWVTPIHVEPAVGLVMCICFRTSAAEALRDPSSSYKYMYRMELDLIGAWFCQVRMKIPSFASHFDGTSSGLIISWTIRVLDGPRLCAVGLAGLRACIAILHARQCGDVALSFRVCSWLLSCSATSYAPC